MFFTIAPIQLLQLKMIDLYQDLTDKAQSYAWIKNRLDLIFGRFYGFYREKVMGVQRIF